MSQYIIELGKWKITKQYIKHNQENDDWQGLVAVWTLSSGMDTIHADWLGTGFDWMSSC